MVASDHASTNIEHLVAVRGRANRFDALQAQEIVHPPKSSFLVIAHAYPDYWAGFQITGW